MEEAKPSVNTPHFTRCGRDKNIRDLELVFDD